MMAKLQPPKRWYVHLNLIREIEEVLENPQEYEHEIENNIKVREKDTYA